MKKVFLFAGLLSLSIIFCGCSQNSETKNTVDNSEPYLYETSDGNITYENDFSETSQGSLIERNGDEKQVSAPDESISFDDAVKMLDSCSFEDLYLAQSVSDYKKHYFDTVTYNGSSYYSIDLYIEANGKRAFAGTNCLVACDGSQILKKTWTSDYLSVQPNKSTSDKTLSELYGNTNTTPNQALSKLVSFSENQLKLDYNLSAYTFEIDSEICDIKGVKCYRITPKLNYTNSVSLLAPYYVTADGTYRVFINDTKDLGSYIEIK